VIGAASLLAAAPSRAEAFTGESTVLNAGKTDLTAPAKSILTNPTFLTTNVEEAAAFGGVAEESAAAGVFQSAGILPALGSVVAFGVGTVIGSEICEVIGIEGCWYHGSEGADPAPGSGGHWVFSPAGGIGGVPAFTWYWAQEGKTVYIEGSWTRAKCKQTPPGGVTSYQEIAGSFNICEGTEYKPGREYALRSSMENRTLEYHATDDPEVENYSYTAPSNWSEKLATQLKNHEGDASGRVGQKIASELEGSEVKNPYATYVTVPSCSGEAWIECKADLEELELVPERDTLTWEDAHLDLAPDEVFELQPEPETELEVGTKVTVTTNPDEDGMPVVVLAPEPNESYDEYIKRLATQLNPERVDVGEGSIDPHKDPGSVLRTSPGSGTRLDPETEHGLEVQTNPDTSPDAVDPGAWSAPTIPSIDLSPLSGVEVGCNDFPFGVFCWIGAGLTSWGSEGECPSFGVPFKSEIREAEATQEFDTCGFEPAMEIVRPMIVILSFFGIAWLLSSSAMGLGGGSADAD
jgi:hypothetical protein